MQIQKDLSFPITAQPTKLGAIPGLQQKEVIFDCTRHGKMTVMLFKMFYDWSSPHCPECKQEQSNEEKKWKQIAAQTVALEARLKSSCIPPRFQDKDFATYTASTPAAQKNLDICQNYAKDFLSVTARGSSMILCGLAGTGKTHLACAIANYIIHHHQRSTVYVHVANALRRVKDTYSKNSAKTEQEAINWFRVPDLLILDEVGVQFGTDTERTILFEIINARYEQWKPTILLSNTDIKGLINYAGERTIDRMKENGGTVLLFNWESYR